MLNPLCLNDTRTYLKRDWIKITDVLGSRAYRRDFGPGCRLPVAWFGVPQSEQRIYEISGFFCSIRKGRHYF